MIIIKSHRKFRIRGSASNADVYVTCTLERGTYYADAQMLNGIMIASADTEQAAYDAWASKFNATEIKGNRHAGI